MFALTTVIKIADGSIKVQDGTLVKLPAELIDQPRLKKYAAIKTVGWGIGEFGYSYFARLGSEGELIIIPGIIIEGAQKPAKRFAGYNAIFTKKQIEDFAEQIASFAEETRSKTQADLNMLVHDLRRLSTTIYNAAVEAQGLVKEYKLAEADVRIENVIAAQTILRIRTDVLDFIGNPNDIQKVDVSIFKKVDKVNRCLRPQAGDKQIHIRLNGASFSTSRGPDVFEIVPYVLIDNALKYSPPRLDVHVEVRDVGQDTLVRVRSWGPKLEASENEDIFKRGFRGSHAIKSGETGSGLGLFLAKNVVQEHFGGTISVVQHGAPILVNGVEYLETEFIVKLPVVNRG